MKKTNCILFSLLAISLQCAFTPLQANENKPRQTTVSLAEAMNQAGSYIREYSSFST